MASETVVSDHSTPSEQQVEKDEAKTMEQEKVPPPKETVESPCPAPAAPLAEAEAKLEEKQVETRVKSEDSPEERKIEDKPVELPPNEEIEKTEDTPIVEPCAEVAKNTLDISESAPEIVKCQSEEKSETGSDEKPEVELKAECVEERPREVPENVDVVETKSVEAVASVESEPIEDKPVEQPRTEEIKKTEEAPVKDNSEVAKDTVPEPGAANISESTPNEVNSEEKMETETTGKTEVEFAEEKPKETTEIVDVADSTPVNVSKDESIGEEISKPASEVTEQTDKEPPTGEPAEKAEIETPSDKAEEIVVTKEECSDDVPTTTQVETKQVEISPPEKTDVETQGKESDVLEGILKEKVEPGKIEAESEPPKPKTEDEIEERCEELSKPETKEAEISPTEKTDVGKEEKESVKETDVQEKPKTEDGNEEKCVVAEELVKPEAKDVEDTTSSITKPEEEDDGKEVSSKDIEPVAENGRKKDETIASTDTCKDALLQGKADEEDTKDDEKFFEDKTKQDENVQDTKALIQDAPKENVPVKTTQKQSNNIIKMVKQSLVKAKKAITGKSTRTKTPAIETKDDGKAK